MSGSLLDDENINKALDSTVKNILGEMNVMLERVKQISAQCLDTTLRIDTISIDVGNLKNEKAVVHKIVRTIEPAEESPSKNKRDILDMYAEKIKAINTSSRHRYVHQIALASNYTPRTEMLIDPDIEPCSSQISTKTDKIIEKIDPIVKKEEKEDFNTSINGHHESESSKVPELKTPQQLAPPKKPIFDSESEEEENGFIDKTVTKPAVLEVAAESKPEIKQNGMLDIQKELAAKFASKTPQVTQSLISENESKAEPPIDQKLPIPSSVPAPPPMTSPLLKPQSEPESVNEPEKIAVSVPEVKTNGIADFKKELAAKLATPKIPQPTTAKSLFSDSESEETPPQKPTQVAAKPVQKSEVKTNGAAKPENVKNSIEKEVQIPVNNTKPTSLSNNKKVVTKPVQKKFSLLDDSDSDEDLFNKSAIVKKPTNLQSSKKQPPVEVKKPPTVAPSSASTYNKPMKSLLDSDSDEDSDSLFKAKKIVNTPAKSILESDDDSIFEKKSLSSKAVDKKTSDVAKDLKKTEIEKPSEIKKIDNQKAVEPKKGASKSIFFESDDSDDELFKVKTKKVITEKPATSSIQKTSVASPNLSNSKNQQEIPITSGKLQNGGEPKEISSSLKDSESSTVEIPPSLEKSATPESLGKIEKSDFTSNLNALLAKKPGSIPKTESSPTTSETSQDSFSSILKSKPKGPNRRPRTTSTHNKTQDQSQIQNLATSSEIPAEEPFFDPLS
ncbi:unnamed protein product [Caenorhabditis angaria]|uniref:Uncharacterized protein n=1 Tax=Caenorhabditis angaria TaxID=860376 RepID=A0A9P1J2N4_9PELO|nr:unnamed protein product [Caenorhabditis angaria]